MTLTAHIEGIAFWSPSLPSWQAAAAAFRCSGDEQAGDEPAVAPAPGVAVVMARPAPPLLAANERRRAPDTVLVALQVAHDALLDAGLALGEHSADLASVFVSTHGDLPITDALCTTLAANPLLLSPTRFHHSVHNAASGYWAIASGSQGPSTALSAHRASFAVGLLEALSQCVAEQRRVLLVAYDTAACGALASVNASRGLLGLALLLAPVADGEARAGWRVQAALQSTPAPVSLHLCSAAAQSLQDNAMAGGLPLFEALAQHRAALCSLPLAPDLMLQVFLRPPRPPR